jgi:gluconate 2-dehydrogenase gamma chain
MEKNKNSITRREAIRRTGMIMGGVIFAPNLLGVLNGCTARVDPNWAPELFTRSQARFVSALSDVIIPKDDTPSASQAGVPAFIESMVMDVYNAAQREMFLEGLDQFTADASAALEGDFISMTDDVKFEYTYNMNRAAMDAGRSGANNGGKPFILIFRELTILGYFTSEPGATQVLKYQPVPGEYRGCVPFEEIGKTWAT